MKSAHTITLLRGDGIGPEVVDAAVEVIAATGVPVEWEIMEAGEISFEREGSALPERTIESVRRNGVALKGPLTTSADPHYGSPNVALRNALDLYATVRPCRTLGGAAGRPGDIDLVVVKMNLEDLYARIGYPEGSSGAESIAALLRDSGFEVRSEAAYSVKALSAPEIRRVAATAYGFATETDRSRVTIVHKETLIPHTDGLFLQVALEVGKAYPNLTVDDALVDTVCERIVARPDSFDVLLMPRMYGDIVSGVAAATVGGVGVAPGVNLGEGCAVFEAAHGSAPRLAGRNQANPIGVILSGAMLLHYIGEHEAADRIESAVDDVVREGRTLTYDLALPRQASTTSDVVEALVEKI